MAKDDGHLKSGSYDVVARCHNVAPRQVSRAYREMATKIKAYVESGDNVDGPLPDYLFYNKRSNCKGVLKYDREALAEEIKSIDVKERKTYRQMEASTGISKTTLQRLCVKENFLRRWRGSLKPTLTESNRLQRVMYALQMIQPRPTDAVATRQPRLFNDYSSYVHID